MSDLPPTDPATSADPPPPSRMDSAAERAVAKAEAAATRRRWITLAEGLAIAGVVIAALTLWTNWSDSRDEDAARKAEQAEQGNAAATVTLVANHIDSGDAHTLQKSLHTTQRTNLNFTESLRITPKTIR